ncbi:putative Amino acid transporter transmembrane domain-containing protein [Seiridium cardinale]|uniref:Amino acid transporter transmembrane domain-containing protein n=1 Tax=Seiridium cardinale TaxID=138064 RepID=A0ABR2XE51_9PEZI
MTCELSPSASAFSAMLSAFIGSVINGLTSGWFVAFMTGWIAWLALFRVLWGAVYMLYRNITGTWEPEYGALRQGEDDIYSMTGQNSSREAMAHIVEGSYQRYGWDSHDPISYQTPQTIPIRPGFFSAIWPSPFDVRAFKMHAPKTASSRNPWGPLNRDVTFLGWVGWVWTALYAPVSQILWVAANVSNHSNAAVKIVKALTVAVTALPLCIDCRVRYGEALAGRIGVWAKHLFNFTNSLSCLLQGVLCAVLLITGALDLRSSDSGFPIPILIIYPIFSLVWMAASLRLLPVRDGARRRAAQRHWTGILLDIGVGAFAGLFVAAPAFALYQSASFDEKYSSSGGWPSSSSSESVGASGLSEYLRCETQVWKKFTAVFP